jgi:hypothetical protein
MEGKNVQYAATPSIPNVSGRDAGDEQLSSNIPFRPHVLRHERFLTLETQCFTGCRQREELE